MTHTGLDQAFSQHGIVSLCVEELYKKSPCVFYDVTALW